MEEKGSKQNFLFLHLYFAMCLYMFLNIEKLYKIK